MINGREVRGLKTARKGARNQRKAMGNQVNLAAQFQADHNADMPREGAKRQTTGAAQCDNGAARCWLDGRTYRNDALRLSGHGRTSNSSAGSATATSASDVRRLLPSYGFPVLRRAGHHARCGLLRHSWR